MRHESRTIVVLQSLPPDIFLGPPVFSGERVGQSARQERASLNERSPSQERAGGVAHAMPSGKALMRRTRIGLHPRPRIVRLIALLPLTCAEIDGAQLPRARLCTRHGR